MYKRQDLGSPETENIEISTEVPAEEVKTEVPAEEKVTPEQPSN